MGYLFKNKLVAFSEYISELYLGKFNCFSKQISCAHLTYLSQILEKTILTSSAFSLKVKMPRNFRLLHFQPEFRAEFQCRLLLRSEFLPENLTKYNKNAILLCQSEFT